MKKLFILSLAAITVFAACNQPATTTDASQQSVPTAAEDSLAGTFTSKDAKSAKLLSIIKLFSKQDSSYLVDYAPNFTLKLMSDTAVIARGPEGFAAYHKNLHIFLHLEFRRTFKGFFYFICVILKASKGDFLTKLNT